MINQLKITELENLIKEEKFRISLAVFYNKRSSNKLYIIKDKAIFVTSVNKNEYYDVMIHFKDVKTINEVLKEIKKMLNNSLMLIYLRNENNTRIYESIDADLIVRRMYFHNLEKSVEIEKVAINSKYILDYTLIDECLTSFFIKCFKNEWDENVEKWFKAFNGYNGNKEILVLKIKNEIVSSVMYWINDNSIYIFLLGTSIYHRKQNLAKFLLNKIQEKYSNSDLDLTVYSDSKAISFYKNLGFNKMGISGTCV